MVGQENSARGADTQLFLPLPSSVPPVGACRSSSASRLDRTSGRVSLCSRKCSRRFGWQTASLPPGSPSTFCCHRCLKLMMLRLVPFWKNHLSLSHNTCHFSFLLGNPSNPESIIKLYYTLQGSTVTYPFPRNFWVIFFLFPACWAMWSFPRRICQIHIRSGPTKMPLGISSSLGLLCWWFKNEVIAWNGGKITVL